MPAKKSTEKKTLRVLFIGDIMGKPGRKAVAALLPGLRDEHSVDVVLANAENLAHGKGVTNPTIDELKKAGVDFCTSGNHIWAKPDGVGILNADDPYVIRPANYPAGSPGKGQKVLTIGNFRLLVVNLMGRVYMRESLDCPFRALDVILGDNAPEELDAIIVDFHAEATSEKNSFGIYVDGKVTAFVGTHTHIPTADNRVLPKGTGYISDIGMVGIRDSSLGIDVTQTIEGFLTQRPAKFEIADHGLVVFNSVLIEIDPQTRKALSITRIQKEIEI